MKERLVLLGCALLGGLIAAGVLWLLVTRGIIRTDARPAPAASTSAAPACAITTDTPACNDCVNSSCGGACASCASNPACVRMYLCVLDCNDVDCRKECEKANPGGKAALEAFAGARGCMATYCKESCK